MPYNLFCLDLKIVISVFFTLSEVLFAFSYLTRCSKSASTSLFRFFDRITQTYKISVISKVLRFSKFYWFINRVIYILKNGKGPRTDLCIYPFTDKLINILINRLDRIITNHLKLHKTHNDSILPTVSGGLQYQKLFVSLQKLCNLYFHQQELFLYSQYYYYLNKVWDIEHCW